VTVEMLIQMIAALRRAGRDGATVKSLSESLGVSLKTVRRSIEEMAELGVPLLYEEVEHNAKVYSLRSRDIIDWIHRMSKEG